MDGSQSMQMGAWVVVHKWWAAMNGHCRPHRRSAHSTISTAQCQQHNYIPPLPPTPPGAPWSVTCAVLMNDTIRSLNK